MFVEETWLPPRQLLSRVAGWFESRGLKLSTAESCTGGLIAVACTTLSGSSTWFESGFVTYSISAKVRMLGVPPSVIEAAGVVSAEVAEAMARGVLLRCDTDVAISVTGVAGPEGESEHVPLGTVWIGWALRNPEAVRSERFQFRGDRKSVCQQAVVAALEGILERWAPS